MTAPEPRRRGGVQPAVAMPNAGSKTAAASVKGADSFTEVGSFSQVTSLKKDNGVWRGQAMRGGTSVLVLCDHQGNIGAS